MAEISWEETIFSSCIYTACVVDKIEELITILAYFIACNVANEFWPIASSHMNEYVPLSFFVSTEIS